MTQKPLSTAAAERVNLVAQDEIWKYRLKAETEARQNWAQNWGFLATPLEELLKGDEEPLTPKPKIELPERFRIRPVTPAEKYIKGIVSGFRGRTPAKDLERYPILPSPPVPKTTQGFIGWRAGVPGLNKGLAHAFEIRSCKGAYAKELSWPEQGIH
ncbi:uncharacterized protein C20orf85 homolog isoform X1 [Prionailurus viverrinus]|uniref:uncharacterized protein C20orf85 homolog isoform X1 n=1 Tax=Prionailurus viverrinus TaxID=61388 RepID=UPI001FF1F52B|nr:uncharacterized protein C20orf85 homolog isoform X1 [Prionailurus viverrinus]